jgi:hypothetical protein
MGTQLEAMIATLSCSPPVCPKGAPLFFPPISFINIQKPKPKPRPKPLNPYNHLPAFCVARWCGSQAAQTTLVALSPGLILRMVLAALVVFLAPLFFFVKGVRLLLPAPPAAICRLGK